jgi:hypothetical protein
MLLLLLLLHKSNSSFPSPSVALSPSQFLTLIAPQLQAAWTKL